MRLKSEFLLNTLGDVVVAVPVNQTAEKFHSVIRLNETGRFLWEQLRSGTTIYGMSRALSSQYNISQTAASRDVQAFVKRLTNAGIMIS